MKQKPLPVFFLVKENNETAVKIEKFIPQNEETETKINENPKTQSNKNEISSLLKEHLTNEMFGTIMHIIHTPHILLKMFLTIFLLISVGLFAYTTVNLVLSYFDYSVTTLTRNIYETPTTFPKITLCNVNQFTSKFSFDYLQQLFAQQNGMVDFNNKNLSRFQRSQNANMERNILNGLAINFTDFDKKRLTHDFSDVLFRCQFNYGECTVDDFVWSFDLNYGNCYSFNSGFNSTGGKVPLKQSSIAGNGYGLELDMYVNFYENLTLFNSYNGGLGAIIRVDNVSIVIDHGLDGILAESGRVTSVALNREFKTTLPKPYSNCDLDKGKATEFDSVIYNLIVNSPFDYTQTFCFTQCLQQLFIEKCNCRGPFFFSVFKNAPICVTYADSMCLFVTYFTFYLENNYASATCLPQCPLECSSSKFTYKITSFNLLGESFLSDIQSNANISADFVTRQLNADEASKSMVKIRIFYDSLSYTMSDESPQWDVVSLIATIGGNLGLFLGLSLFSLGEVLTTLFELGFYFKQRKRKIKDNC